MNDDCPNCGGSLMPYRTEHQHAGQHDAHLAWSICPACQHVALRTWSFDDPAVGQVAEHASADGVA